MAFIFGESWDPYAVLGDAVAGYWDGGSTANVFLTTGRFAGSQALSNTTTNAQVIHTKSSGANDAVHHISVAFRQTLGLSGTTLGLYFQLVDVSTNQVCIVFRSDGTILLTSATPGGTVLATYAGAVSANNTWFQFEFEVVINNVSGSFKVRKNGSTTDDHSTIGINTRPGANSYANKLQIGVSLSVNAQHFDDLLWRSDASGVPFVGDIRAYTRMPASDAAVQFARSPATNTQTVFTTASTTANAAGTARYSTFTAAYDGTIATATVSFGTGYTGNLKCSIFASSGTAPTTVVGSANVLVNPANGTNTITFGTPVAVSKGVQYWIGFDSDTSSGTWNATGVTGLTSTTAYASFPAASPATTVGAAATSTVTITPTTNYQMVNETLQDGATSYVYDSTVNDADFYTIGTLASTPATVVAVTTRGFLQKSDAGTRGAAVQLKSGATTVASTPTLLSSSFCWLWRTDVVDPNTSTAWTAAAVNNVTIGPKVTS